MTVVNTLMILNYIPIKRITSWVHHKKNQAPSRALAGNTSNPILPDLINWSDMAETKFRWNKLPQQKQKIANSKKDRS